MSRSDIKETKKDVEKKTVTPEQMRMIDDACKVIKDIEYSLRPDADGKLTGFNDVIVIDEVHVEQKEIPSDEINSKKLKDIGDSLKSKNNK